MADRLFIVFYRGKTGKKDRCGDDEMKYRSCRAYELHSDAIKFKESVNHDPSYHIVQDGSDRLRWLEQHGFIPEDDVLDGNKIFRAGDPRIEAEFARRKSLGRIVFSIEEA